MHSECLFKKCPRKLSQALEVAFHTSLVQCFSTNSWPTDLALSGLHEPLAETPPQGDQIARALPPTSGTLAWQPPKASRESLDSTRLNSLFSGNKEQLQWHLYKSTKECRRSRASAQLNAATSSSGKTNILVQCSSTAWKWATSNSEANFRTNPQTPCTQRPFRAPTNTFVTLHLSNTRNALYVYILGCTVMRYSSVQRHACRPSFTVATKKFLRQVLVCILVKNKLPMARGKRPRSRQALTVPNFIEPYCKSSQQPGRRSKVSLEAKVVRNVRILHLSKLVTCKIGCVRSKSAGCWPAWTAYSVHAHRLL